MMMKQRSSAATIATTGMAKDLTTMAEGTMAMFGQGMRTLLPWMRALLPSAAMLAKASMATPANAPAASAPRRARADADDSSDFADDDAHDHERWPDTADPPASAANAPPPPDTTNCNNAPAIARDGSTVRTPSANIADDDERNSVANAEMMQ
jgi:hypothetical protein